MSEDRLDVIEGIRRGEAVAEEQLARIFSDGIRFYLQRHVGTEDLEERVRFILAEMAGRIRDGWVPQTGELSAFLGEVTLPWRRSQRAAPVAEPSHARIQAKAEVLKSALRDCSKRDLEMLIRYYVNGQDIDQVTSAMGATEEELNVLKWRFRRLAAAEKRTRSHAMRAGTSG